MSYSKRAQKIETRGSERGLAMGKEFKAGHRKLVELRIVNERGNKIWRERGMDARQNWW
jgi:hypothetical protein